MATTVARLFGVVFILVGVLGFVPAVMTDEKLLGIFHVNPAHNAVHIALGLWGLFAASSAPASYLRGVAVIYALLAILGLIPATQNLFGLAYIGGADVALHAGLAVVAGIIGFMAPSTPSVQAGKA